MLSTENLPVQITEMEPKRPQNVFFLMIHGCTERDPALYSVQYTLVYHLYVQYSVKLTKELTPVIMTSDFCCDITAQTKHVL